MRYVLRLFWSIVFLTSIGFPLAGSQPSYAAPLPSPTATYSYFVPFRVSADGKTVTVADVHEVQYSVDISSLRVEVGCARQLELDSLQNVRIELLRHGCAEISGAVIEAERQAQEEAKGKQLGIWNPSPSPSTSSSSPGPSSSPNPRDNWTDVHKLFDWAKRHRLISIPGASLILAILASPWLLKSVGWLTRLFYRRRLDIILAGLPGAGKSGLWNAWKDEYNPGASGRASGLGPTPNVQRARLESVMLPKWTLRPVLVDAGGHEPWQVLNEVKRSDGIKGAFSQRAKRILLVVVSPRSEESTIESEPFDASYVIEQHGYCRFPMAIIGAKDTSIKPGGLFETPHEREEEKPSRGVIRVTIGVVRTAVVGVKYSPRFEM